MQRTQFRADVLPSEGRWPAWNQTLSRFAVDTAGQGGGAGFDGAIATCVTPSGLSFTLLESQAPQRISSNPGKVEDVFWLSLVLSGSGVLDLGGEPIAMAPGDILYGKRGVRCSAEITTGFRKLLVNIPGPLLSRRVLVPLPNKAIFLSGRSGVGKILSGMLAALAESFDELDETLTGPVEAALPQFLLSCLFGENGEQALGGSAAVRAGVLQRVWRTIEANLDDPGLCLGQVAAAQGLSTRYVQKLFEESGQTFSGYLRRRRLEQCRTDLANPVNAGISIIATCFQWGFNDPATFSRAFREEFGVSPREYRRVHLPRAPSKSTSRRARAPRTQGAA